MSERLKRGFLLGGCGLENNLKEVAIGVDATLLCGAVAMPLYADFVPSHFNDQVELESENWPHTAKPCGGLAQLKVQLYEPFRGNIEAKP